MLESRKKEYIGGLIGAVTTLVNSGEAEAFGTDEWGQITNSLFRGIRGTLEGDAKALELLDKSEYTMGFNCFNRLANGGNFSMQEANAALRNVARVLGVQATRFESVKSAKAAVRDAETAFCASTA